MITTWPTDMQRGKVIQLYVDDEPILVFKSAGGTDIHSGILEEFLAAHEIFFKREPQPGFYNLFRPTLNGERYLVAGMGTYTINPDTRTCYLNGGSFGYGIGISREHTNEMKTLHPDWTFELR